jgi:hypothetical protein
MTPEELANLILTAAGSSELKHYMPSVKKEIIAAAEKAIDQIKQDSVFLSPSYDRIVKVDIKKGETIMLQHDGETVYEIRGQAI